MAKELRLAVTLEIPDDIWEQADKLSAAKPIVEAFTEALAKLGGKVEAELVTPKLRGEKGDSAAQYVAAGGKMPA
jgi:hypothetical protein